MKINTHKIKVQVKEITPLGFVFGFHGFESTVLKKIYTCPIGFEWVQNYYHM